MQLVQKIKQHSGLRLFIIVFITISFYYLFKYLTVDTEVFRNIEVNYARILVWVLNLFSGEYSVDVLQRAIVYKGSMSFFSHVLVTKYYLLSALILFLLPSKIKKSILIFFAATFAFFTLTVSRLLLQRYLSSDLVSFFIDLIISLRYLILYKLLFYKLNQFSSTALLIEFWDKKIANTFVFSLNTLLTLLVFVRALSGLFDWFLVAKWNIFVVYLTSFILELCNGILWVVGFPEAYTWGKFILLNNYWLFLDSNCLGVGLMVVFTVLVAFIKSPLANKLVFIGFGLIFINLMNAIRLGSILLYIFKNQIPAPLIKDYHDLSNNIFYIVVFFIILLYINWFQFVNLRRTKKSQ